MARPDPIQYAERLYGAIRAANFSPISFLAFGNAIKDGMSMRNMPRIAAEPFMRVVGEMLDLEEEAADTDHDLSEAELVVESAPPTPLPTTHEPRETQPTSLEPAAVLTPEMDTIATGSPPQSPCSTSASHPGTNSKARPRKNS